MDEIMNDTSHNEKRCVQFVPREGKLHDNADDYILFTISSDKQVIYQMSFLGDVKCSVVTFICSSVMTVNKTVFIISLDRT